ncbi:MAG: hypothetical protein RL254_1012 [Planctomycetota bacterium]|jgi:hypothetical protein
MEIRYEDAAIAHQVAWDRGDYEECNVMFRAAREAVADKAIVVQMGDGALQLVPKVE